MIEIKDARDSAENEDAFVRLMWNAQILFGKSYKKLQDEVSYTKGGWSEIVRDCGIGAAFAFAAMSSFGWECPEADFNTFYEGEQVGSAADIADAEEKMKKLFFDFCYDVSLFALDTEDADKAGIVLRDIVAIGSMFYTKERLFEKCRREGSE